MEPEQGVIVQFVAELVVDASARTGEGPVWVEREQALFWLDIPSQLLHRFDPSAGVDESFLLEQPVGAIVTSSEGGFVVAARDGFGRLDPMSGRIAMIAEVESQNPLTRMNDGKCDAAGRFWAGTMAWDPFEHRDAGTLYRLDPDGSVQPMLRRVGISNGLGWSPDSATMYFIDSLGYGLDAFEFDATTGSIAGRRRVITYPFDLSDLILADGMTVDEQGCLWIAVWGSGTVERRAPDGSLVGRVEIPTSNVTSCAFGGRDLADLYITTSSEHLKPDRPQQGAGGLFRARPGVRGIPANAYAG